NQDAYLTRHVPDEYRTTRKKLLRKYSTRKYKLNDAKQKMATLDEEIRKVLAEKFKVTPEKVQEYWGKRDEKKEVASYGNGSWIALDGQSGGWDFGGGGESSGGRSGRSGRGGGGGDDMGGIPGTGGGSGGSGGSGGDEAVEDWLRRFMGRRGQGGSGGGGRGSRRGGGGSGGFGGTGSADGQHAKDKKLQTSQEWWESASSTKRQSWLEAFYAENSDQIEMLQRETRKCANCNGFGVLKSDRYGAKVDVLCRRCHGTKEDVKIHYK
ncbi:MAG: hypothetical protein ACYTAF_10645, partial [Planctomycetota bacterium]